MNTLSEPIYSYTRLLADAYFFMRPNFCWSMASG